MMGAEVASSRRPGCPDCGAYSGHTQTCGSSARRAAASAEEAALEVARAGEKLVNGLNLAGIVSLEESIAIRSHLQHVQVLAVRILARAR